MMGQFSKIVKGYYQENTVHTIGSMYIQLWELKVPGLKGLLSEKNLKFSILQITTKHLSEYSERKDVLILLKKGRN